MICENEFLVALLQPIERRKICPNNFGSSLFSLDVLGRVICNDEKGVVRFLGKIDLGLDVAWRS